jgi:hypothetical protein
MLKYLLDFLIPISAHEYIAISLAKHNASGEHLRGEERSLINNNATIIYPDGFLPLHFCRLLEDRYLIHIF